MSKHLPPGVYDELPETDYHSHPALSASGMKVLLKTPALFDWQRRNGRAPKRAFDEGHIAHSLVLGKGSEYVVVQKVSKDGTKTNAGDYLTKSAQQHRDEIRAEGKVPVLADFLANAKAMADEVRKHELAASLLNRPGGQEISAFWTDPSGVELRCRFDQLPNDDGSRLLISDYKTAQSADPTAFVRKIVDYGYDLQADNYEAAARHHDLGDDPRLLFIVQEKTPPYLVSIIGLDSEARQFAAARRQRAIALYAECVANDHWPGYPAGVHYPSIPPWELAKEEIA